MRIDLNPEQKRILFHGKCDVKGLMGLGGSSGWARGVSPYLESSILTTLPSFMPWADVIILKKCPRTTQGFLFKGIFANMGSLILELDSGSVRQVLMGGESSQGSAWRP